MPETKSQPTRVDLEGALAGHYLLIDQDKLTMGFLEDLDSGRVAFVLKAIADVIAGSDLLGGHDYKAMRALKPAEFRAIVDAVKQGLEIPKAS